MNRYTDFNQILTLPKSETIFSNNQEYNYIDQGTGFLILASP